MSDGLTAPDVIRSYLVSFSAGEQYGALIDDLEKLGFREKGNPKTLWLCPYDWRLSNFESVKALARVIDQAAAANPGKQITIIGHSMGGLISRCYLESGDYKANQGFAAISTLITLGTPHRGAPEALMAIVHGMRKAFLSGDQVKKVANDPRFPSVYQLLPPPGEPFAWNLASNADLNRVDIYDVALAAKLGLNAQNLQAARDFWSKLGSPPAGVRYFYFAGTREETVTAATYLDFGNSFRLEAELRPDGGDGTVPIWSAMQTGIQSAVVGAPHGTIYKDNDLRNKLGRLLGRPGVLAMAPSQFQLTAREEVVPAGSTVHLTLAYPAGTTSIAAHLRFAELDGQGRPLSGGIATASVPVNYSGLPLDHLSIQIPAPDFGGVYALELSSAGGNAPLGRLVLIVQE
jgi:pimeloyl-ACP methyl ester carboxylesterase